MFGNFEEQQKMLQEKLRTKKIEYVSNDGELKISMNGNMEIENISVDLSKMDLSTSEQLEDLLVVSVNEAILQAQAVQAEESQKALSEMLPGGLGDLGKMFG